MNKIALNLNHDKRIETIYSIEIYGFETKKDLMREKEEIKCNNIIKQYKKD